MNGPVNTLPLPDKCTEAAGTQDCPPSLGHGGMAQDCFGIFSHPPSSWFLGWDLRNSNGRKVYKSQSLSHE